MPPIGKYVAWQLCAEIWEANQGKWFTLNGFRCWNCWRISKLSPADREVSKQADYRGCPQVNRRYDAQNSREKGAI